MKQSVVIAIQEGENGGFIVGISQAEFRMETIPAKRLALKLGRGEVVEFETYDELARVFHGDVRMACEGGS